MSLIAWYKLNGDANDASGNGLDGSPTDLSWEAGKIGGAGSFNGSTSVIDCGDPTALRLTTFTLCAWVKSSRAIVNEHKYWFIVNRGSIYADGYGFLFYDRSTEVRFDGWTRNGGSVTVISAPSGWSSIAEWNHVALARTTGGTLSLYVNGVYQSGGPSYAPSTSAGNNFRIGDDNRTDSSGLNWQGLIDDARVYDEALSARQIAAIYNFGRGTARYDPWRKTIGGVYQRRAV